VGVEGGMTRPLPEKPIFTAEELTNAEDYPDDLGAAARTELVNLWHDLGQARRSAINGVWSVHCDHLAYRIVMLSRIVGACPWGDIDVDVLLDGLYARIHDEAGIPYPEIDWVRVREVKAYIEEGARR
jgi:hypothetical protein